MSSERIVCSQEVHLRCSPEKAETLARTYTQEFEGKEGVQVLRWGYTSKQKQGYIILDWDGEIDEAFLDRIGQSQDIQDFYKISYDITPEIFNTPCHMAETSLVNSSMHT